MRTTRIATICVATALGIGGAVFAAAQVLATDVHMHVPTHGIDLQLSVDPTLAPVVGEDGETLVGPDGRERCVPLAEPPAALAAPPDVTAEAAVDANVDVGDSVTLADRPLTLADTVPC